MKCPKDSSLVVLFAVYKRVQELQARYDHLSRADNDSFLSHILLSGNLSDVLSEIATDIARLRSFLRANNYPLP